MKKFKEDIHLLWNRIFTFRSLETALPCIVWLRQYNWREWLKLDVMAGITVGVMLVPQALAYATVAGMFI